MSKIHHLMIVGVGGQGTLLASRILGNVCIAMDYDVKVSEVHGMSQRGGSVVTYVKYGEKVYSPIVQEGEAELMLAFEQLEGYRWLSYLAKDGQMIVNTQKTDPMPVIIGAAKYPENILEKIEQSGAKVKPVDALAKAIEAGNSKAVNVVLLGVLAKQMEFPKEVWVKAIEETVPQKFLEANLKAFEAGYVAM